MRRRLLFVAGIAVGYVIGTRAARPAYEAVVDRVRDAIQSPTARRVGGTAKEAFEARAPQVAEVVGQVASTAADAAAAAREAGTDEPDTSVSKSERPDTKPSDPAA